MEFKNRERNVANKRRIVIEEVVEQDKEYVVLVEEATGNLVSEGTPITAEIMTDIYQKANAAENVSNKVSTLEANVGKVVYDQDTGTYTF